MESTTNPHRDAEAGPTWLAQLVRGVRLSRAQRAVVDVVLTNPRQAAFDDVGDVARRAGVNASTVVRCTQALGFAGWPAFRQELRSRELTRLSLEQTIAEHAGVERDGRPTDLLHASLANDTRNLARAAETVDLTALGELIDGIATSPRTLVAASGTSVGPALVLTHLGATLGLPVHLEMRGGTHLAAAVASLRPDDLLIVVHLWRPMRDLVGAMRAAQDVGCRVGLVTDLRTGPMAGLAEPVVAVPSEGVSFTQSVTAATSVMYAVIAGLEARDPERSRAALARTQATWDQLGVYAEEDW